MKRSLGQFLFVAFLSLSALAQNVSGRYKATLTFSPGNTQDLLLILDAQGTSVQGSIGPDESRRFFFTGGVLQGNTVTYSAGGLQTELTISGTSMKGFASPPGSNAKWRLTGIRKGDLTMADRYAPLTNEDGANRSQRIIELRDALHRQEPGAEQRFWRQVQATGTPLTEQLPGDSTRVITTFLWHGSAATKNVLLQRGRFTRFQPQQNLFSRVDGTDVWFKTLVLPAASRFQYAFSENDPAATFPRGEGQGHEQRDVLNPKHLPEGDNAPESSWHSLLELPAAAAQPWYVKQPPTPKYEERDLSIQSQILSEKRDLKVYLPPGFADLKRPLPVLYMLDGEDPDGLVFATWTLENLVQARKIPPIVVVRVINPSPALREKELGCDTHFSDYMSGELAPYIEAQFHVTSDQALTGIGGYSRGGLASACVALRHPERFGLVVAQSGAFWWEPGERSDLYREPNWVAQQYAKSPRIPVKFYLEAGLFEIDLQGGGGDILETTRTLRDVLQAKGNEVFYHEFAGDHDYINWRGTFADALIDLFGTGTAEAKGFEQ